MSPALVAPRLWDFSVRLYEDAGVAESCLWLQDEHGLDVNVLLFCLWAGATRGRLEPERIERAGALSQEWQANVVGGLRRARRWMKLAGAERSVIEIDASRALREKILEQELVAEKLEQEALERSLEDLPAIRQTTDAVRDAARANARAYLSAVQVEMDAAIEARLAVLLDRAASPQGGSGPKAVT